MRGSGVWTHGGKGATGRFDLEGTRADIEGIVVGLCGDRGGGGEVVLESAIARGWAIIIVIVVEALLGGLRVEGEGRNVGRRRRSHDGITEIREMGRKERRGGGGGGGDIPRLGSLS